jgi:NAD(P)-dependent dehydrogenase (short-subunit alcohol dehydrogenase family)
VKINLTGVFFTIQAIAHYLNNGASVMLNSQALSVLGAPGYSANAASKAGARAMGRVLASELSPRGIRVNVVTPGGLYADLVRRGS